MANWLGDPRRTGCGDCSVQMMGHRTGSSSLPYGKLARGNVRTDGRTGTKMMERLVRPRPVLQCRTNFKHVCLGKRVRAVWQLRRSRAIFTARRKLASNTRQGHLGEVASVLVLSVFSAGELVRDVVTAVGDCSFRRRFLWGRKSNEFAQPNMNRYHKSVVPKARKIKEWKQWSSTIKEFKEQALLLSDEIGVKKAAGNQLLHDC